MKRIFIILLFLAGFSGAGIASGVTNPPVSPVFANPGPNFTIFPNPANGSFFDINFSFNEKEFPNVHLAIVNVLGQTVYNYNFNKMDYSNGRIHLDISELRLNKGIYFVQLVSGESTKTVRLAIR